MSDNIKNHAKGKGNEGLYCLGGLGALVYYVTTASSFWLGVLGILKAMVWPAFFVYEILKFIGV